MKTIELTEEQVKMIVKSINQTCRDMEMYLLEINKPSFDNIPDTIDVKKISRKSKSKVSDTSKLH